MSDQGKLRMAASNKALWLCCLYLFLGGCSGSYQMIPVLTSAQDDAHQGEDPGGLEPGDRIRLTQETGNRIEGTYAGIQAHSLVMNRAEATYSEKEGFDEIRVTAMESYGETAEFPLAEIVTLEKYNSRTTESLLVGAGIIGFVWAMIYAFDHTMDDFDFED